MSAPITLIRSPRRMLITRVLKQLRDSRRRRIAAEQMASLSDHALRDIGVPRAAIHTAVRTGKRP